MRIGIDLGGTKTEGIVLDDEGNVVARERVLTPAAQGYEAIITCVAELAARLERRAGEPCTVGVGTPGSLSSTTGLMKNSNTVCLNGRALDRDLSRALGRPVRIANDANCFALSEAVDGAGKGHGVVFGVILGTGVGGGIVMHGRLHEGPNRIGGEWGHNVLEADGPPCYCGRRGCVETLLSGPGLAGDYRRHGGAPEHDARAIAALADAGDAVAGAALERYLARFGRALASVLNVLDPDVVVLGGGLSALEVLYRRAREALAPHVFNDAVLTPVVRNHHGDASGVRGAAWLWRPAAI